MTPEQRFIRKIRVGDKDSHWIWTAGRNTAGYGAFKIQGRQYGAHRIAYLWLRGPIPAGHHLDHLCRVPACVNPAHLEPVTPRENTMRSPIAPAALNVQKTHCPKGHPYDHVEVNSSHPYGQRSCRTCSAAASLRWYHRTKKLKQVEVQGA